MSGIIDKEDEDVKDVEKGIKDVKIDEDLFKDDNLEELDDIEDEKEDKKEDDKEDDKEDEKEVKDKIESKIEEDEKDE